jgi:hypothetical protein
MTNSTSAAFFDGKYFRSDDPWNFEQSGYEHARYNVILSELGGRLYARGFEPGCSVGVLTLSLAAHCKSLVATDISYRAVELAQQRCSHLPHVRLICSSLRTQILMGMFDLIVFSEIGYYFTAEEMCTVTERLIKQLEKGGTFLAVHWLGVSKDHLLSGDRVHEILRSASGLRLLQEMRYEAFRIDRWKRL